MSDAGHAANFMKILFEHLQQSRSSYHYQILHVATFRGDIVVALYTMCPYVHILCMAFYLYSYHYPLQGLICMVCEKAKKTQPHCSAHTANMSDWEEIKRLAADLQRAQQTSTIQKLSERNCVEIVQKLIECKLLDVIYTTDGREYLTHQELGKEIREELLARGGRVNLVDLQAVLNVDLSHVENKVNDVIKGDKNLTLVLGQLIDQCYLDTLAEEINDRLQDEGRLTIAELAKSYDLPGHFISKTIQSHLGVVIQGEIDVVDRDVLFTEAYIARHHAIVKGAFSAITRPTPVIAVINLYGLHESLFYSILEGLVSSGQLAGTIAGGRQERAHYIPDIYTRVQNEWVDSFFKQNGYLEYDTLSRLGISDPKSYIKKRFKSNTLQYLSSCCMGSHLEDQIEAEIAEALGNGGWFDILPSLPSICTENDAHQLLTHILRRKPGVLVFCDSIVADETLISTCQKPFYDIIKTKAQVVARTNPGLLITDDKKGGAISALDETNSTKEVRREQRRKKASAGKSGGGTQGREVKTKSTKKKSFRSRDADDSDDDSGTRGRHTDQEFMSMNDIEAELKQMEVLQDSPEELIMGVAQRLHRPLNKLFLETAKSIILHSSGGATRKRAHGELTEKITSLWMNAKLFEKGLKLFNDDSQGHLTKYLLKTICTDITNIIITCMASDYCEVEDESLQTTESRGKVLNKITEEHIRSTMSKLNGSLNGKSLDDFFHELDRACGSGILDIILRKPDKKKERQVVFHHRQALIEQLKQEIDPALSLHLASVLLFQVFTQCMLHAPGRLVPHTIALLGGHLTADNHLVLMQYQDLVMQQLRLQQNDKSDEETPPECAAISRKLAELLPQIKDIALTTKKSASAQASED